MVKSIKSINLKRVKVKKRVVLKNFIPGVLSLELTVCYYLAGRHESSDNDRHVPVGRADWIAGRRASHGSDAGRRPATRPGPRATNQQITFLRVTHHLPFLAIQFTPEYIYKLYEPIYALYQLLEIRTGN